MQGLDKNLKGTRKQTADAAFRCPSLKNFLIKKKTLEALRKECNDLCSRNNPSLLHMSGSDDMENFSLQKLSKEWKERGPLFPFLMTCATLKERGCDSPTAAVVAGSTVL